MITKKLKFKNKTFTANMDNGGLFRKPYVEIIDEKNNTIYKERTYNEFCLNSWFEDWNLKRTLERLCREPESTKHIKNGVHNLDELNKK